MSVIKSGSVVVTGGTRGIGLSIARSFASQGNQVFVLSRNTQAVNRVATELGEINSTVEHVGLVCDVSRVEEVESACKEISAKGAVKCLINAAGISHDGLLARVRQSDIDAILNTNLVGAINMSKYLLRPLLKSREGCIINLSSVVGLSGNVGQSVYSASKAGLIGFTKSLAKELAPKNIRVNAIAPGFIDTDMTSGISEVSKLDLIERIALRRFGAPEEIADAAMFLAQAKYITGQTLVVDGGMSL
ncbi:NAD(P)-binding protein [Basidiobolus meristosporus CBS 931.73]|uniref:3-oxoacyl-[acyl-carrier-protein] reductase n=1 Tax=Basidiobolus meristosporus CBS 931.73 TaxID=1314790 RepID=A0A1Y1YYD6_9FUNG|nr:NAD(P)-binding protein [Basidiobolus meristosporus CBS 931.73]|eukprot:ORY02979.1 NAD(P)-binding protein [Basidiobolus meristosporus CBS 931.73]